ncbi:hypothetical protein V6Z12_D05G412200 [Gossypium hirsutum]
MRSLNTHILGFLIPHCLYSKSMIKIMTSPLLNKHIFLLSFSYIVRLSHCHRQPYSTVKMKIKHGKYYCHPPNTARRKWRRQSISPSLDASICKHFKPRRFRFKMIK